MLKQTSLPEKTIGYVLFITVIFLMIFFLVKYQHFYHDDEMISLRYARNFLQGNGLIWNPGERIEGYTNFLHLVMSAGLIRLTGDYLVGPRILNFLFLALLLVGGYFVVRNKKISTVPPFLSYQVFLLIVACFPGVYIWSYGALEVVMYSSLLFMAVSSVLVSENTFRAGLLTGVLFACTAMTRPEGNFIFIITAAFYLLLALREKKGARFAGAVVAFGLVYGIYFLLRWRYYGQFLPNTFYAKTNFTPGKLVNGAIYLLRFLLAIAFIAGAGLVLIGKSLKKLSRQDTGIFYLAVVLACYVAYISFTGGDHMLGMRFCIPLLPLLALLMIFFLNKWDGRAWLCVRVCLFLNAIYVCVLPINSFRMTVDTDPAAAVGFYIGSYIHKNMPPDFVVATNSAGAIPFFAAENRFIDMLGLCDSTIAHRVIDKETARRFSWPGHEKGDGNYVVSRRPDIIIIGPAEGNDASNPTLLSDVEIVNNPLFTKLYEKKTALINLDEYKMPYAVSFRSQKATNPLKFTYYQLVR